MSAYRKVVVFGALVLLAVLVGCNSVHVKTGAPSDEQIDERSDARAKEVRSDFAEQMSGASPLRAAGIVRTYIDSAASRYLAYGEQISDHWRQMNDDAGMEVADTEIRKMIDNSTESERPVFDAYDDAVDYGIEHLEATGFLHPSVQAKFDELHGLYYQIFNFVFYPNGLQDDYSFGLTGLQAELRRLSGEIEEAVARFH